MKIYQCDNPACPLGTLTQPGRFTAGGTIRQHAARTGEPFDETDPTVDDPVEGVCPNCGAEGVLTDG